MRHDEPSRRELLRSAAVLAAAPAVVAGCAPAEPSDESSPDTDPVADTETQDTDPAAPGDTDAVDTAADDTEPVDDTVEFDPLLLPEDTNTFGRALSAGAMRPTSARLVTHVDGEPEVIVRVWADAGRPRVRLLVDVAVRPGDGGFTAVDVDGLLPGSDLQYGFFRIDVSGQIVARSPLARFRTPPVDDAEPVLTVAVQSCNGGATRRNDAMGRIADHPEVDAILHVGDMAYNDGSTTLSEYRRSWAEWTTSEGFRAGLGAAGLYATWDDHEIDNNWNPEEISATQIDVARRTWGEAVAVVLGPDGRVWQSYRWGRTAEILVLDCRSERRPSTRGTTDEYLSRAQMEWLKTRLKDSPCRFKVVMNSVPITNMPSVWDVAADDRWEGYPKQRRELFDWIDEHDIADVWFVAGDFHVGFVGRIQSSRPGRSGRMWEVAVTSGNVNPLGAVLQPPQFRYGSSEPRLVTVTFDPATGDVTARFYNPGNNRLEREIVLNQGA